MAARAATTRSLARSHTGKSERGRKQSRRPQCAAADARPLRLLWTVGSPLAAISLGSPLAAITVRGIVLLSVARCCAVCLTELQRGRLRGHHQRRRGGAEQREHCQTSKKGHRPQRVRQSGRRHHAECVGWLRRWQRDSVSHHCVVRVHCLIARVSGLAVCRQRLTTTTRPQSVRSPVPSAAGPEMDRIARARDTHPP